MTDSKKYNGWTNYPTWRVRLEIIDGMGAAELGYSGPDQMTDTSDVADAIKAFVDEIIIDEAPDGLVKDYANAFLDDVNWYEIAEHLIEDEQVAEPPISGSQDFSFIPMRLRIF